MTQNATYGQNVGSIEIKASWIQLPEDGSLNERFKIAQAEVVDPYGNKKASVVGLVSLHIVHKLPGALQFAWATFEQIDNSPDDNNGRPSGPVLPPNGNQKPRSGFAFSNPACTSSGDPDDRCLPNQYPGRPCAVNATDSSDCTPYTQPIQVTRMVRVGADANNVTAYAWSLMPEDSVFRYCRLIDVQCPNQPTTVRPGTTSLMMPGGDITPAPQTRIVANTTMETYQQQQASCMSCHQVAPIAQRRQQVSLLLNGVRKRTVVIPQSAATQPAVPATDYSFIFSADTGR